MKRKVSNVYENNTKGKSGLASWKYLITMEGKIRTI